MKLPTPNSKKPDAATRVLSRILRRNPEWVGITLDSEGWVDVVELAGAVERTARGPNAPDDLQSLPTFTVELVRAIAAASPKQFAVAENGSRIRAVQSRSSDPAQNRRDLIQAKLVEYAANPSREAVERYSEKLIGILSDLQGHGYDTARLENELVASLRSKEEGDYLNYACELSAAGYFAKLYPRDFRYQVPTSATVQPSDGTPKTFDFSFVADRYTFNVEVKAFKPLDLEHHGPVDEAASEQDTLGDENPVIAAMLMTEALHKRDLSALGNRPLKSFASREYTQSLHEDGVNLASTRATAITRLVKEKANQQLVRPENGLSVVLLCCNDHDEFADVLECLCGRSGVLSPAPSSRYETSVAELPNIDVVVVCNLGMNHSAVIDKARWMRVLKGQRPIIAEDPDFCWDFSMSLPIAIPLRQDVRPELIEALEKTFYSHTRLFVERLSRYEQDIQRAFFKLFGEHYAVPVDS